VLQKCDVQGFLGRVFETAAVPSRVPSRAIIFFSFNFFLKDLKRRKNQKSKIKNQKSKIKNQKSNQK
jgi:hypothetical protein